MEGGFNAEDPNNLDHQIALQGIAAIDFNVVVLSGAYFGVYIEKLMTADERICG